MGNETAHKAGDGTIWILPNGPNTKPVLLGCHMLDDIKRPRGDQTLRYCPDISAPSKWKAVLSYKGEPGPVTTTITTYVQRVMDVLESLDCPVPLYILKRFCGRGDTFTNYDRAFALPGTDITNEGLTQLVAREPGDENASEQSFDVSAQDMFRVSGGIKVARQSIAETASLNDIAFCNTQKCEDSCGEAQAVCDDGFVVGDYPAGSPAVKSDVWYTNNGGGAWAFDGQPFAAGEDVASAICFPVGKNTTRWLVARGTTDAGNPAEVAYSDDGGLTWTNVDVGTVDGQYVVRGNGLFALDQYHVWCVTTGGYIYFSDDGGLTWAAQEAGVLTVQNYNAIWFSDASNGMAVGDVDNVATTGDGGTTWSAGTATGSGDDLISVYVIDSKKAWVGADEAAGNATLYYTTDGATTWAVRTFSGHATGDVSDVQFVNELIGWMIHNTAAPVGTMFRTINGGYDWEAWTGPTNAGLNALWACGPNLAFAVGEASGGTAVILKAYAA